MRHAPKTFVMPPVSTGPIHMDSYVILERLDSYFLFPPPPPVHVACFLNIFTTRTTSEDIGCVFVYLLRSTFLQQFEKSVTNYANKCHETPTVTK